MQERLNQAQIKSVSKFFSDLAKILFASAVVGFFIPSSSINVTTNALVVGSFFALSFFIISVTILKNES